MKKNLLDINSKENVSEIMRRIEVLERYVKIIASINEDNKENKIRSRLIDFSGEFKRRK
jgi:hypothetical protein